MSLQPTREHIRTAVAQSMVIGLEGPEPSQRELALLADPGLGGVILFARNVQSPAQVWALNQALRLAAAQAGRPPIFVMVDQEGGSVARLHAPFCDGPDLRDLGSRDAVTLRAHGQRMGRELVAAGFNFNLAPVVDVHAMADGVMARRSLGPDPAVVGELAAAFIQGQQEAGCLACAKHFPGLGRTTADTHKHRPVVGLSQGQLAAMELPPFRRAIQAGVAGIMICHAVFPAIDPQGPASLSRAVIEGLLRGQLGFGGLVLSDDLEMGALAAHGLEPTEAAVRAYQAGCDLLLICRDAPAAVEAVERLTDMALAGQIDAGLVAAKTARIQAAKAALAHQPPPLERLLTLLAAPPA